MYIQYIYICFPKESGQSTAPCGCLLTEGLVGDRVGVNTGEKGLVGFDPSPAGVRMVPVVRVHYHHYTLIRISVCYTINVLGATLFTAFVELVDLEKFEV